MTPESLSFAKLALNAQNVMQGLTFAAAMVFPMVGGAYNAQAAQPVAFTAQGDVLEGANVLPLSTAASQKFEFGVFENGAGYQSQSGEVVYLEYNGDFGCSVMPDGRAVLFDTEYDVSTPFIAPHVMLLAFNQTAIDVVDIPEDIADHVLGHCAFTIDDFEEGTTSFYYTDAFSAQRVGDFVTHPEGYGIPFKPKPQ